jgi:outer membrane protein
MKLKMIVALYTEMKNFLICVGLAAVTMVVAACDGKKGTTPTDAPAGAAGHTRIGVVNTDSVLSLMPEYNAAMETAEKMRKDFEAKISAKQQVYQNKMAKAQKDMEAGTMNRAQAEQVEKELAAIEREVQKMMAETQTVFAAKERELTEPILKKMDSSLTQLAKEKGYSFIADQKVFLYAAPSEDLTGDLIIFMGLSDKK